MKRVLYIGSGAPWMGGAGYLVRQRMFLRALAGVGGCELTLGLFDLPKDASAPPFQCKVVPLMMKRRGPEGRLGRAWADLVGGSRMIRGIDIEQTPWLWENLESIDALFGYRIDFSYAAGLLELPHLWLDVDDPEHVRWRRRVEAEGRGIDWRTERDLRKLRAFELDAVRGAERAFVCQAGDVGLFPSKNVRVVPNGVEVPAELPERRTGQTVLFLGNFAAGAGSPNYDALVWFMEHLWPRIRTACPTAVCRVVGKMDAAMKERVQGIDGMVAVGFADSLAGAFAEARLSVAPLRFGTGTRIKILDSFAQGCPVVSTTVGAEGLEVTGGENILLGDSPDDFAAGCVRLLKDEDEARRLGAGGYRLVREKYDAAAIEAGLCNMFKEWLKE